MGTKELRQSFNEVLGTEGNCIKALLEYEPPRGDGIQWQVLYFSGSWASGAGFAIKSDRIRPNGDVNLMARETAERLLQQKGST